MAIIGGSIGAVVVLVLIVILSVVFFTKLRDKTHPEKQPLIN